MPVLRQKFEVSLARRYAPRQRSRILELYDDAPRLDAMPVHEFVEMFVV
jgi:2-methylcitrate dehydratase